MMWAPIFMLLTAGGGLLVGGQTTEIPSSSPSPGSDLDVGVHSGCASWPSTTAKCFVTHVEVMPLLALAESTTITSAAECQQLCVTHQDCAYFTFSENGSTSSRRCSLKPSAGYGASPVMMLRRHPSSTATSYISGPKVCGQKCVEESPIEEGCGASSFASCALLSVSAKFDPTCSEGDVGCSFEEFPCCRECSGSANCCSKYGDGKLLDGGVAVVGSGSVGVFSAEHCKTLCYAKDGCTHWNYVTSTMQSYMGGSCFLKRYVEESDMKLETVESHYRSIYGSTGCESDQGPAGTTETPPKECFTEKVKAPGHDIFIAFGVGEPEKCQEKCQTWPACTTFAIENNHCHIKFSNPAVVADESEASVVGPRVCGAVKPIDNNCLKPDTKLTSPVNGGGGAVYANDAVFCYNMCRDRSDCSGWTYKDNDCFLHGTTTGTAVAIGYISGSDDCDFPEGTWSRRSLGEELTTEDALPSSCVDANTALIGGDLDIYSRVVSVERCHDICLKRQDCKFITYNIISQMCFIKWGGVLTMIDGSVTVPRVCSNVCATEICPTDIPIDYGTPGLAMINLGTPQEWRVQGSFVQFNDPRSWSRITLILLTGDTDRDCYVSDMVSGDGSCWDQRESYLPIHFKVQIVAVTNDHDFLGWDQIAWEQSTTDDASHEAGFLEFLNEEITIVESGSPASDHGAFIKNIAGSEAPLGWPASFLEPSDFSTATYYSRFQVLETPEPLPVRFMVCITGSDQPPQEICQSVSLPPYNV